MKQIAVKCFILFGVIFAVASLKLDEKIELPPFCDGPNKDNPKVVVCCKAVKAFERTEQSSYAPPELKECEQCGRELCSHD
uniref:4Fe-4S ferredoxin-type domain-containing protein n=1 Tax=Globodera pallida TaxID=36090 RepID=A0A183C2P3_GLOPA